MIDAADEAIVRGVLSLYDLGEVLQVLHHSGTAARTWRVRTRSGWHLLRTRGIRTSSDQAVAFDHGLRRHLVACGLPTAAPVPARDGATYARMADRVYEVYPFIQGLPYAEAPAAALVAAAESLARFHDAASGYACARSAPPVAQYATLGLAQCSTRMEDPALLRQVYEGLFSLPGCASWPRGVAACRQWLDLLDARLGEAAWRSLPHALTHGDYTPANLLFDEAGRVAGIFDLDWARWASRVRDVADGMYFFAAVRGSPLRPGDIWSLTETAEFDAARCAAWVAAYGRRGELSAEEIASIPFAFAARWLSIRAEGMAKVPQEHRLRFCLREIEAPLAWLEAHWTGVESRLA